MLIRERLETFEFSPSEKIAVQFLLSHPEKIENITIQQLAKLTYTQPSTIVRIAKKLNYYGWKDLKKAYLEEWRYLRKNFSEINANIPFNQSDTFMDIAKKIAVLETYTIEDILSLLHHDNLSTAKQLLLKAQHVHIFAENSNALVSQDFALKMNRIGKNVLVSSLKNEEEYEAYNLPANTCTILISYSGENKRLLRISEILKKRSIPIIAITSIGDNSLSKRCSCSLPITTREKLYSKIGNFTINLSITYLLDVLYSIVFAENYDKNFAHLKAVGKLVDRREINIDFLKET